MLKMLNSNDYLQKKVTGWQFLPFWRNSNFWQVGNNLVISW